LQHSNYLQVLLATPRMGIDICNGLTDLQSVSDRKSQPLTPKQHHFSIPVVWLQVIVNMRVLGNIRRAVSKARYGDGSVSVAITESFDNIEFEFILLANFKHSEKYSTS